MKMNFVDDEDFIFFNLLMRCKCLNPFGNKKKIYLHTQYATHHQSNLIRCVCGWKLNNLHFTMRILSFL